MPIYNSEAKLRPVLNWSYIYTESGLKIRPPLLLVRELFQIMKNCLPTLVGYIIIKEPTLLKTNFSQDDKWERNQIIKDFLALNSTNPRFAEGDVERDFLRNQQHYHYFEVG